MSLELGGAGLPLLDDVLQRVRHNALVHLDKWPDLAMLLSEVSELAYALVGRHEHEAETELIEIAGLCVNWLRRLYESEVDK